MATATTGYTWASGNTVLPGLLNQMVNSATITLSNDEVTTAKILDANVTAAKLASNAVETAKIADDAVTNDKLTLAANAGEVKKALNADNAPPIFACRAWVNFDGTRNEGDTGASTNGANVKIRAGGNVSSVLKNTAGDYTITFTTAMPDANYVWTSGWMGTSGETRTLAVNDTIAPTASSIRVAYQQGGLVTADKSNLCIAIFR
jgi:hypothetical protein